jgi:multidrug resistance efflux pump
MFEMDVCSPKDGFVMKLLVRENQAVEAGATLLELDSEREEAIAERIRNREKLRELYAAQYSGEQLALARSIAKSAVDSATEQFTQVKLQADVDASKVDHGLLPAEIEIPGKIKLAQASFDLDRARSDQKQLEYSIERHLKSNELAKSLNEYYLTAIKKRIERLKITAPISGHVKLQVQQGSFAELGSTLLEIS